MERLISATIAAGLISAKVLKSSRANRRIIHSLGGRAARPAVR
jgi:hypothetical protein